VKRKTKNPNTKTANINFRVLPARLEVWRAAAEKAGVTFTEWASRLLDGGAKS
jgi:hypothetical protein